MADMDKPVPSLNEAGEQLEKAEAIQDAAESKVGNDTSRPILEDPSSYPNMSEDPDLGRLITFLKSSGKVPQVMEQFGLDQDPWVAYKKMRQTNIGRYVIEDGVSPFSESTTRSTGKDIVFTTPPSSGPGSLDGVLVTINSSKLVELMERVMHPLLVHEAVKLWENKPPVQFRTNNVLLAHSFDALSEAASTEAATDAGKQLQSLLENVKEYERATATARDMIKQEQRVDYDSLWTLFPPGRQIVAFSAFGSPQIFTVYRHGLGTGGLMIKCWSYDWDGARLVRQVYQFVIDKFFGSEHIRELPCYPLQFYYGEDGKTPENLVKQLSERGKRFARLCISSEANQGSRRPVLSCDKYYTALASEEPFSIGFHNRGPRANAATNVVWTDLTWINSFAGFNTEHLIVVDAAMYTRYAPGNGLHIGEKLRPIMPHRCNCELCNPNDLRERFETDFVERTKRAASGLSDTVACEEGHDPDVKGEINDDLDIFYAMLPGRLLGYVVDRKQWAQIPIDRIKDEDPNLEAGNGKNNDIWDQLALEAKQKKELKTIVENHFQRIREDENRIHDLMQGKGEGLVLLLHGVPGVGKTMTAEALAKKLGRYLIRIEASDFHYDDPGQVSAVFRKFFNLAHSWGALVLLDEADVFLQRRERQDLAQNALVSGSVPLVSPNTEVGLCLTRKSIVLLRQLEYFQGVLITTTNRILSIDYAVQSRINYAINFRGLSKEETKLVWETFFKQLNTSNTASRDEIDNWFKQTGQDALHVASFTGRDIRNLFTTAQLLQWPVVEKTKLQDLFETIREFRRQMERARVDYTAKNTALAPDA